MKKEMTCGTAIVMLTKRGIAWDSLDNAVQIAMDAKFATSGKGWKKPEQVKCHAKDPNNCPYHKTGKFSGAKNKDLFDVDKFGAYNADDIKAFLSEQLEAAGVGVKSLDVSLNAENGQYTVVFEPDDADEAEKAQSIIEDFVFDIDGTSIDDEMWKKDGSGFKGAFTTPESEDAISNGGEEDDADAALNDDILSVGTGATNKDANKAYGDGGEQVDGSPVSPEAVDAAIQAFSDYQDGMNSGFDAKDMCCSALNDVLGTEVSPDDVTDDNLDAAAAKLDKLYNAISAGSPDKVNAAFNDLKDLVQGFGDGDDGSITGADEPIQDILADAVENAGLSYENPEWDKVDGNLTCTLESVQDKDQADSLAQAIEDDLHKNGYTAASVQANDADGAFTFVLSDCTKNGGDDGQKSSYLPDGYEEMATGDVLQQTTAKILDEVSGASDDVECNETDANHYEITLGEVGSDDTDTVVSMLQEALGPDWTVGSDHAGLIEAVVTAGGKIGKAAEQQEPQAGGDQQQEAPKELAVPASKNLDKAFLAIGKLIGHPDTVAKASEELSKLFGTQVDLTGKDGDALESAAGDLMDAKECLSDGEKAEAKEYWKSACEKLGIGQASAAGGASKTDAEMNASITSEEAGVLDKIAEVSKMDTWFSMAPIEEGGYKVHDQEDDEVYNAKEGIGQLMEGMSESDYDQLDADEKKTLAGVLKKLGIEHPFEDGDGGQSGSAAAAGEPGGSGSPTPAGGQSQQEQAAQVAKEAASKAVESEFTNGGEYAKSSSDSASLVNSAHQAMSEAKALAGGDQSILDDIEAMDLHLADMDHIQQQIANAKGEKAKGIFKKKLENSYYDLLAYKSDLNEKLNKLKDQAKGAALVAVTLADNDLKDFFKSNGMSDVSAGGMAMALTGNGLAFKDVHFGNEMASLPSKEMGSILEEHGFHQAEKEAVSAENAYKAAQSEFHEAALKGDANGMKTAAEAVEKAGEELKKKLLAFKENAGKVKNALMAKKDKSEAAKLGVSGDLYDKVMKSFKEHHDNGIENVSAEQDGFKFSMGPDGKLKVEKSGADGLSGGKQKYWESVGAGVANANLKGFPKEIAEAALKKALEEFPEDGIDQYGHVAAGHSADDLIDSAKKIAQEMSSKSTAAAAGGAEYSHENASPLTKAQQAVKNLEAKVAAAKDPAMKAVYEKVLEKLKAHHGLGDGPEKPDGGGSGGNGGGNPSDTPTGGGNSQEGGGWTPNGSDISGMIEHGFGLENNSDGKWVWVKPGVEGEHELPPGADPKSVQSEIAAKANAAAAVGGESKYLKGGDADDVKNYVLSSPEKTTLFMQTADNIKSLLKDKGFTATNEQIAAAIDGLKKGDISNSVGYGVAFKGDAKEKVLAKLSAQIQNAGQPAPVKTSDVKKIMGMGFIAKKQKDGSYAITYGPAYIKELKAKHPDDHENWTSIHEDEDDIYLDAEHKADLAKAFPDYEASWKKNGDGTGNIVLTPKASLADHPENKIVSGPAKKWMGKYTDSYVALKSVDLHVSPSAMKKGFAMALAETSPSDFVNNGESMTTNGYKKFMDSASAYAQVIDKFASDQTYDGYVAYKGKIFKKDGFGGISEIPAESIKAKNSFGKSLTEGYSKNPEFIHPSHFSIAGTDTDVPQPTKAAKDDLHQKLNNSWNIAHVAAEAGVTKDQAKEAIASALESCPPTSYIKGSDGNWGLTNSGITQMVKEAINTAKILHGKAAAAPAAAGGNPLNNPAHYEKGTGAFSKGAYDKDQLEFGKAGKINDFTSQIGIEFNPDSEDCPISGMSVTPSGYTLHTKGGNDEKSLNVAQGIVDKINAKFGNVTATMDLTGDDHIKVNVGPKLSEAAKSWINSMASSYASANGCDNFQAKQALSAAMVEHPVKFKAGTDELAPGQEGKEIEAFNAVVSKYVKANAAKKAASIAKFKKTSRAPQQNQQPDSAPEQFWESMPDGNLKGYMAEKTDSFAEQLANYHQTDKATAYKALQSAYKELGLTDDDVTINEDGYHVLPDAKFHALEAKLKDKDSFHKLASAPTAAPAQQQGGSTKVGSESLADDIGLKPVVFDGVVNYFAKKKEFKGAAKDAVQQAVHDVLETHPEYIEPTFGSIPKPYAASFHNEVLTKLAQAGQVDLPGGSGKSIPHVKSSSGHKKEAFQGVMSAYKQLPEFKGVSDNDLLQAVKHGLNQMPDAADKETGGVSLMKMQSLGQEMLKFLGK